MWRRILSLFVKEMLALLREPKSRFVVIVPPLLQLLVFSYAATYDVRDVSLAVLDESRTAESRALVSHFAGAPSVGTLLHVANAAELHRLIDARQAMAGLHIGPRFAAELRRAPPATVNLILDGRMSNTAQVFAGYAAGILDGFNRDWGAAQGWPAPPSAILARAWFNPNFESLWVVVPGLVGVLTMVVGLVVTALSVARERELGTLEQLLVTPLRPLEVLVGKTLPAVLVGLVEGSFIVAVALLWFQVPLTGSVALLYLALLLFLLAVIGVGLFISALAATQQQAIVGAFLFLVPAIILSGFASPIQNMPDWLQAATWANPVRHMMVILRGVFLKDMPAEVAWESLWPMALIGFLCLAGASWFFRRRLG